MTTTDRLMSVLVWSCFTLVFLMYILVLSVGAPAWALLPWAFTWMLWGATISRHLQDRRDAKALEEIRERLRS